MRKFMKADPYDSAVNCAGDKAMPGSKSVESKSFPASVDLSVNASQGESWGRSRKTKGGKDAGMTGANLK